MTTVPVYEDSTLPGEGGPEPLSLQSSPIAKAMRSFFKLRSSQPALPRQDAPSREHVPIKLVVGLGNPGKEYEKTRHNLGFLVVEELAEELGIPMKKERKFLGWLGRGRHLILLMPSTYMNESGRAVQKVCRYYQVAAEEVLVICDDAALPFGTLRLRGGGSAGGHNGLKSIQQALGTMEYPRLRIGVGHEGDLADHVLGPFNQSEKEALPALIDRGAEAARRLGEEPLEQVMNEINRNVEST